ncbi:MAG TPA: LytTR family DNA-binding domain-containing protein [Chitinophagaceae bacterium]|nr:LytTR family DNA-binding domain-containing protein [Chitinophagaceae bacterium]
MKSCIIIDDENRARQLLANMLSDLTNEISVVAECDDLPSGVKAIKKFKPDLVFLDIEMPGHSGLEILDYFEDDEITFDIIFATGYSEYAIQAFKLSAIDYLLKPLNPIALKDSINRFLKNSNIEKVPDYRALQENIAKNNDVNDKCIVVNLSTITRFIKVKDILMLQAEGSYCNLFLQGGEKLMASKNLKHFEDRLSDIPFFFRSHKSFIINLKQVIEYNRSENSILLQDKLIGMISTDKSDLFIEKMETLL